jgi:hypothetical protein
MSSTICVTGWDSKQNDLLGAAFRLGVHERPEGKRCTLLPIIKFPKQFYGSRTISCVMIVKLRGLTSSLGVRERLRRGGQEGLGLVVIEHGRRKPIKDHSHGYFNGSRQE